MNFTRPLNTLSLKDLPLVGGKTASLGELIQELSPLGVNIPPGFAVTAVGFDQFMEENKLTEKINRTLQELRPGDVGSLAQVGREIRGMIRSGFFPISLRKEIEVAYQDLSETCGMKSPDVAVRSSATAEDLPDASFAGQQETFLNVRGADNLLEACRNCFASLFTDRAISYRVNHGFSHADVKLTICVQKMVRSDLAASGIIFTLDPESGARNTILLTSAWGLGENVVGGKVDPDEFLVQKELLGKAPCPILKKKIGKKQLKLIYSGHGTRTTSNVEVSLADQERLSLTDQEILQLATWAKLIEAHYSKLRGRDVPMDIEWGKDGESGKLFILQARPETVHSLRKEYAWESYKLEEKAPVILTGRAVGAKIGQGPVRLIRDVSELPLFQEGDVLVTDMTDPDWEPVMKKASAIVTNRGGRTCHAAIIGREHGVPCVVGTGHATTLLKSGESVTVSCAQGEVGVVYAGLLKYSRKALDLSRLPTPKTKIMLNLGNPDEAFKQAQLPVSGVGLARMEFIISEHIRVHPMALIDGDKSPGWDEIKRILPTEYLEKPSQYFVDKLAEGIAVIAGAFYPRPVIVRFSDFKTNEYAHLLGGKSYEPLEENPMLGFRGASRYYHPQYRKAFALECAAIKKVRQDLGLVNVKVMIPFCRTVAEGKKVLAEMKANDLARGEDQLEVFVMAELPSNVISVSEFAEIFDGFSIGSNDLTQMVLGVDRDSSELGSLFDERDPAVMKLMSMVIRGAKEKHRKVGICGQAPSDYPELARRLMEEGIDSISVTPDAVFKTIEALGATDVPRTSTPSSASTAQGPADKNVSPPPG